MGRETRGETGQDPRRVAARPPELAFAYYFANYFVIVFFNAALVSSALSAIVLSALYLYAAEKKVPQAFDGVAQVAFGPK